MRGFLLLDLPIVSRSSFRSRSGLDLAVWGAVMRHDKGFSEGRRPPGFRPAD